MPESGTRSHAGDESEHVSPILAPADIAQFVEAEGLGEYGITVALTRENTVQLVGEVSPGVLTPQELKDVRVFAPSDMILCTVSIRPLDENALTDVRAEANRLADYAKKARCKAEGVEVPQPIQLGDDWYLLEEVLFGSETCRFTNPLVTNLARLKLSQNVEVEAQPQRQRLLFRVMLSSYREGCPGIVDLTSGRALIIDQPFPSEGMSFTPRAILFEPLWDEGHRLMAAANAEVRRLYRLEPIEDSVN